MTENIANLINALREELAQYGTMLALLDGQQKQIGARHADGVYQSIGPIKQQGLAIQKARAHREECRAQLAQSLQQGREFSFAKLIPLLPEEGRAVLGALVKENNDLLARVRVRARQNHLQLSRSIELIQSLIHSIFPAREPRVYNDRGSMKARRPVQRLIYEAIG
jgi:flagellar biosynthesis/type III secretory pathway chaperone